MKRFAAIMLASGLAVAGAVQGGGISVPLAVSPEPQLDFGEHRVGSQSDSRTVTVSFPVAGSTSFPLVEITNVASTESEFQILNNNCTQLGGVSGPTSCTFDTAFTPSQVGEFLADLQIECQVVVSVGVTTILCNDTPATQTVADYFRGIGVAASAISVPTLGQWGITFAALTLIGLGAMRLRRR